MRTKLSMHKMFDLCTTDKVYVNIWTVTVQRTTINIMTQINFCTKNNIILLLWEPWCQRSQSLPLTPVTLSLTLLLFGDSSRCRPREEDVFPSPAPSFPSSLPSPSVPSPSLSEVSSSPSELRPFCESWSRAGVCNKWTVEVMSYTAQYRTAPVSVSTPGTPV